MSFPYGLPESDIGLLQLVSRAAAKLQPTFSWIDRRRIVRSFTNPSGSFTQRRNDCKDAKRTILQEKQEFGEAVAK